MSTDREDWVPPVSYAPATAEGRQLQYLNNSVSSYPTVYELMRVRMRNLRDLRKFGQEYDKPRKALSMTPGELRKLERQHFPTLSHPSILEGMSDEQVSQAAKAAKEWLFTVLDFHTRTMAKDHEMRMFRQAVEKELGDGRKDWTEQEQLYMALSNLELTSPEDRLKAAFMVVLHGNLPDKLEDISKAAAIRTERLQDHSDADAELVDMLEQIADRTQSIEVDHFACAIPLSLLTTIADNKSVVDDNAGCCPICQNSYTDLSEFTVEELLADYPVRIKYCNHVVGKSCLEQWMITPKINEARYPHRTCPLCRVKIEGVEAPKTPRELQKHLLKDRRALESVRKLVYDFGVTVEESIDTILACMSEEIACNELLAEIKRGGGDKEKDSVLKGRLDTLKKEKRVWGFRGDGVWRRLREEWMNSTKS